MIGNWIEEEKSRNCVLCCRSMYPVDLLTMGSTRDTEMEEKPSLSKFMRKTQFSVLGRPGPVSGQPDTQENSGVSWDMDFHLKPRSQCARSTRDKWVPGKCWKLEISLIPEFQCVRSTAEARRSTGHTEDSGIKQMYAR